MTLSIPGTSTRICPKRSTRRAVTPVERIPTVIVHGRKAMPVCSALKWRTCSR